MRSLLKIMETEGCIGLAGNHQFTVTNELTQRCLRYYVRNVYFSETLRTENLLAIIVQY